MTPSTLKHPSGSKWAPQCTHFPWGLRKSPPLGTTSITQKLVKKKKNHLSVCHIYKQNLLEI